MSRTRWWMTVTVAAIGWVGLASARASWAGDLSGVEVQYTVRTPDATNPKAKGAAPQIEATVVGAPNLTADKFVLVDKSANPPVQVKAVSRRAYNQGPDTLAVAIVMLGWEMWIGNDTYRKKDDLARVTGVLVPLQAALDKLSFKTAGPPGSLGVLITYGNTATIRVPMGPLGKLSGSALGKQADYKDTTGLELVKGVELALAELHKVTNPRKVLIVITDGEDTKSAAAKAQLALLKKQAQTDRVQAFAIVYKAADSGPNNVISYLTPAVSTVTTIENIAVAFKSILERIADRQYLTFPGFTKGTRLGLKWDGKPHDLAIKIEKDETEPQAVVLEPKWAPPAR